MSHSLKAHAVGTLRPDFINLTFSPEVRGNLLILKGQWPGTGKQKKSNIADYFETPWCLLPFVLGASKSVDGCVLNLKNCQQSKEGGQVGYCREGLLSCNSER